MPHYPVFWLLCFCPLVCMQRRLSRCLSHWAKFVRYSQRINIHPLHSHNSWFRLAGILFQHSHKASWALIIFSPAVRTWTELVRALCSFGYILFYVNDFTSNCKMYPKFILNLWKFYILFYFFYFFLVSLLIYKLFPLPTLCYFIKIHIVRVLFSYLEHLSQSIVYFDF